MFTLPSIFKSELPHSRLSASDWYLIVVIYLMPTAFLGFLPHTLLYVQGYLDYRLLTFASALPLLLLAPAGKSNDFWRIPGIRALCIVACAVVLRTAWSLLHDIPLFEVVAVLRWNFVWPLYAICVLFYASRLPADRLYGVLRIFLVLFVVHVCLVGLSLATGVDFFLNTNSPLKNQQLIEDGMSGVNLRAFPVHIFVGAALITMGCMVTRRLWTYYLLLLLCLSLPAVYTRRMYSVVLVLQTVLIYIPSAFLKARFRPVFVPLLVLLFFALGLYCIAPSRIDRFAEKLLPVLGARHGAEKTLTPKAVGTYAFRTRLLEEAAQSVAANRARMWGMGYRREDTAIRPGEKYSYVLGEDSIVAPVVFCEGWGGVLMRILPYLALLMCNLRRVFCSRDRGIRLYAVGVLGVIIAQVPAYLQSALICRYDYFYMPLAFIELLIVKRRVGQV